MERRLVPTTTTTITPKPTTTTTKRTTTMQPETTVDVRENEKGGVEKMSPEGVDVIGNILATLGFDLDSSSDSDEATEMAGE